MGNNTSPSQFVGWTIRSTEGKKCRERLLPHYFQVGSQWNSALMGAERMGRDLKEIHIRIFLPVLPCTWQIPGSAWPLGTDFLKASCGKSSVRSFLNQAKRWHWRQCGHIPWKRMRWMWAGDVAWAGLANSTKRHKGQSEEGFWGWTSALRTRYNSGVKLLTENTRTQWTWCTNLWVHKEIARSGVIRAMWNKSSFGTSTLGWVGEGWRENVTEEQSSGTWWSERLLFQASSGHDNVDSESQKESKHMHAGGEASALLTAFSNVLRRLQCKTQVELESAWLQWHVAEVSILLSELSLPLASRRYPPPPGGTSTPPCQPSTALLLRLWSAVQNPTSAWK